MSSATSSLILIKRSNISGIVPKVSDLYLGELGLNTSDGNLFTVKTDSNSISSVVTFLNSDQQPFISIQSLSAVKPQFVDNTVSQSFACVLGGYSNDITGGGSTVLNGEDNDIHGDYSVIGSGYRNRIYLDGECSFIAAGSANEINHPNVFTLGSDLTSHAPNFTYVNNLSVQGFIYGDGSNLTGIVGGSGGIDTEVRSLTSYWDSTYSTVQSYSANWEASYSSSGTDLLVRSLTANWDSTYTTVQTTSSDWQTAYAYVSANSINLTATNIIVTNDLTVTDTVSAKFYQGTILDWMTLVRGYKTTPTLNVSLPAGDVYNYIFSTAGSDVTYYRYIANNGSEDSFYGNFTNPTLSNLITTKKIIL